MKFKYILILLAVGGTIQPALAADEGMSAGELQNYVGYGFIVTMLLLFLIVMLVLLRTFKILTRIILKQQGYTEEQIAAEIKPVKVVKKPKEDKWIKLLSLRPMADEKEILIEHDYDGIQELNNPTPTWFMVLFYGTIIFAVCYLCIYHVFGIGQLQYDEYKTEVKQADIAKKEYLGKEANRVDDNTVKLVTDPAVLSAGHDIFKKTCVVCHGEHGQGNIGPNLTDDYWLHGNKINDLFKTIKYGVAAKGMPTWEKQLSPKQIADVANYVKSLHGTNPPNPKEPQGVKEIDDEKSADKKTAAL